MSKTNTGRGAAIIAGVLADLERAMNEDLAAELGERIATALDKAEARGAKRGITCQPCSCPKCGEQLIMPRKVVIQPAPQFDADEVKRLVNAYGIAMRDVGEALGDDSVAITEFCATSRIRWEVRRELFTALGISE